MCMVLMPWVPKARWIIISNYANGACATYGNRAAKWTATELSETRVVTKQTNKLEASYHSETNKHLIVRADVAATR